MQATLRKFQLGFLVIGTLTGILFIWFIVQSVISRQDVKTQKAAVQIAEKINDYVADKQKVPSSLTDAGADDVPSQITYEKLSDSKYKFCVNYKGSKKEPEVVQTARLISALYFGSSVGNGGFGDYTSSENLYIPENHDKGEFCQTIEPYIYSQDEFNFDDYNLDSNSSDAFNFDDFQTN